MKTIVSLLAIMTLASGLLPGRVLVHGHRGARAVLPENTLPAFEYAIKAGVDVLELDLAVTKDNVIVVSHDSFLSKPTCSGPRDHVLIRQLTLKEVRQYDCGAIQNPGFPKQKTVPKTMMPTLDEVLALSSRGTFEFNIETKIRPDQPDNTVSPEEFAELLWAALKKHNVEKRTIVQSFDFRTLHAMKKLAPEIRLSALFPSSLQANRTRSFVEIAKEAGAGIVSPYYTFVTKEQVGAAHAAGLQVVPWTANTEADWQKLIEAGADAIITDDPGSLIAYLQKERAR